MWNSENITQEAFSFLDSILEPPPIVCTSFYIFKGRIKEATHYPLRKCNVIPLSKTTSIFRYTRGDQQVQRKGAIISPCFYRLQ